MRLIDAINVTLEALGESRAVDLSSQNPSVGLAKAAIERTRRGVLSTGWWFNTISREVTPAAISQQITVPWKQVAIYGADGKKYSERDGKLYDLVEQTAVFTAPVKLNVVLDFDFEDLPEHVALWIAYDVAAQVYNNDFGGDTGFQILAAQAKEYEALTLREHLRNQRYSTSRTRGARAIRHGFRL